MKVKRRFFNPAQMDHLGPDPALAWRHASVQDRAKASLAHEDMELRTGPHELTVEYAPETVLNIGSKVRKLLRVIRLGDQRLR